MASVRKKNDKWQVQIRRKGFPPVSKTFVRRNDAMEWARMMESTADRRGLPPNTKILDTTTLGQIVVRYRDEIASKKKCASVEIFILNAFLRHPISGKFLSEISKQDWSKYCDDRLATLTSKSLDRELSPLKHMYRIAAEEWGISIERKPDFANPAENR